MNVSKPTIRQHTSALCFKTNCRFLSAEKILVILLFLFYLAFASVLPASQSPDEISRLLVPFYISDNGCLPNGYDEMLRHKIWGQSYGFTVYGASLFSVIFINVAKIFTADMSTLIFAARIPSCIFGALGIATLMKIATMLDFNRVGTIIMGLCLGILPQYVFLSSYHNADIFSMFCSCLVIYSWLSAAKHAWNTKTSLMLGVSLGLLALSYYFAYLLIPLSIIFFIITAKWQHLPVMKCVQYALMIFIVAFLIAGWFFIRNYILYDGDFFGMRAWSDCSEIYAQSSYKPSTYVTPKSSGKSFTDILFSKEWLWSTFTSSICCLGYMEFTIPKWTYIVCLIIIMVAVAISAIRVFYVSKDRVKILLWTLLFLLFVGTILLSAYRAWSTDYQAQGRYIIVGWISIVLAIGSLMSAIADVFKKRKRARLLVVGIAIVYSLILLFLAIYSAYPDCFLGIMDGYEEQASQNLVVIPNQQ